MIVGARRFGRITLPTTLAHTMPSRISSVRVMARSNTLMGLKTAGNAINGMVYPASIKT
jgi:hypothetical protein